MKHVDRDLYIGDTSDADHKGHDDIDSLLLLTENDVTAGDRTAVTVPIDDNGENDDELLKLVLLVGQRLRENGTLMVACDLGISRSVAIAATLMSLEEGNQVRKNIYRIKKIHSSTNPHEELVSQLNRIAAEMYPQDF